MKSLIDGFINPSSEFTPFPFWFLNGNLNNAEIERQLTSFASKGVMGVVLHPRIGIPDSIKYLSDEFIGYIEHAVGVCKKLGMKVLLYDEGMYPSGSANGLVVKKNPDFAAKGMRLLFSESDMRECERELYRIAARMPTDNKYIRSSARVLTAGERLREDERELIIACGYTRGTIRGIHALEDDGEPNAPPAGDILNPDAVSAFINITHEAYYSRLKAEFGKTIIGIFTDEPSPVGRNAPKGMLAWTDGFESELISAGLDIIDFPALWLSCGEHETFIRSKYRKCLSLALARAYYRPIAKWCDTHGISLCGHPHSPQDIALMNEFHIPGQDIVWRWVAPERDLALSGAESAQAKCASDSARHRGARRNLNECFGCCGKDGEMWSLNVDDMKWYLNWLFARGCNMIIPHAFFYELKNPAQFDRPPDAGPNNIWWEHYGQMADYIKRMCMLNTDCVNLARVAVLATGDACPVDEVRFLYEHQVEFNYLTDDDLINRARMDDGSLRIANQRYDALMLCALQYDERAYSILRDYGNRGLRVLTPRSMAFSQYKTVRLSGNARDIRATHIKRRNDEIVMLFNEGERDYNGRVLLPVRGNVAVLDAWSGAAFTVSSPDGALDITLPRRGSAIYASCEGASGLPLAPVKPKMLFTRSLDKLWKICLPNGCQISGLRDWREIDGMELYSGSVRYSCQVSFRKRHGRARLSLGDVCEQAEAYVNGKYVGAALLKPFNFDIINLLDRGVNTIDVVVTNSLAPKHSRRPIKSGMFGNTKITIFEEL